VCVKFKPSIYMTPVCLGGETGAVYGHKYVWLYHGRVEILRCTSFFVTFYSM